TGDLLLEPVAPPHAPGAPRLYGRSREIARLIDLWRSLAGAATPELALLTGAPGCGKSLLAHTPARHAGQPDAPVARIGPRARAPRASTTPRWRASTVAPPLRA